MQIDWLTVGAQWINFLILMWLLRRFLYQPIIRAMDKRQQAIANSILEARQKAERADQAAAEYREKLAELENQRAELIHTAHKQAEAERENLIQQARAETQNLAAGWRQEIERERTEFQQQFCRDLGYLITATARNAVADLSGLEWQQALFANFIARLQQLPDAEIRQLADTAENGLTLASSFELDQAMRDRFRGILCQTLTIDPEIRYGALANSRAGLKLSSTGYSLEWTIEDYFADLDTGLQTILAQVGHNQSSRHVA